MAKRTCSVDGCDRAYHARGLCKPHYCRWWRKGVVYELPTFAERFNARVDKRSPDECWPWLGTRDDKGYGRIGAGTHSKYRLAHRVAYEMTYGTIPDGAHVCHHCDHPWCVNPRHMFLGSNDDNIADKVRKGRARGAKRGAEHHNAKLTAEQVRAIRHDQRTQVAIAADYGIGQHTVSAIKRRKTWNWLP